MVVVGIVGLLSAVALPRFLGMRDKAKLNLQLGEGSGLAKECAATILSEGPYPANYASLTTNSGLKISGNCNQNGKRNLKPTRAVTYTTEKANPNSIGVKCGQNELQNNEACVIQVNATTGDVTYKVS